MQKYSKICYNKKKGFITLMSVLIVSAVGLSISISLILLGLGASRSSFALEQSKQAQSLAILCAEEGLQQIRNSTPFAGTGNLTVGLGTCTYTVINLTGQNRTITASGTIGTIIRKIAISIDQINPQINITSWQEVADF